MSKVIYLTINISMFIYVSMAYADRYGIYEDGSGGNIIGKLFWFLVFLGCSLYYLIIIFGEDIGEGNTVADIFLCFAVTIFLNLIIKLFMGVSFSSFFIVFFLLFVPLFMKRKKYK